MFAVPPNTVALAGAPAAAHPARLAAEVARDRRRWSKFLRYDPDERFSVLLEASAHAEIWLLSWLPGQHTDLHDHGGATGAFIVVSGVLTERVSRSDSPVEFRHRVAQGQSRVFGPNYVHEMRNEGTDPAVSIHAYRPHRAIRVVRASAGHEPVSDVFGHIETGR